jgi:hypothetical protein
MPQVFGHLFPDLTFEEESIGETGTNTVAAQWIMRGTNGTKEAGNVKVCFGSSVAGGRAAANGRFGVPLRSAGRATASRASFSSIMRR